MGVGWLGFKIELYSFLLCGQVSTSFSEYYDQSYWHFQGLNKVLSLS